VAKKKLNKKVAIIGSLVMAVVLVGIVLIILRFNQRPGPYIVKGDESFAKGDYKGTLRYYGKALALSKDQAQKNEITFKLAELFKKTDEWDKALKCWNNVAVSDKTNIAARQNILSYYYDYCDSGGYVGTVWNGVATTAGELIALQPSPESYFKKGRAELEITRGGGQVDQEKKLDEAIADLGQAIKQSPKMADAYEYMIQAYAAKSEMYKQKGVAKERADEALAMAMKTAEEAIKASPEDPSGYTGKLLLKLSQAGDAKQVEAMEPDFLALVQNLPKSSKAYKNLMRYYGVNPSLFVKNIDKSIDAANKAFELDQTAGNALALCDLYYRRAYLRKDVKDLDAAIETAKKALELPDAKDTGGPRAEGNKKSRRLPLYSFLATCNLDKALEWNAGQDTQKFVKEAEDAIYQVEQIFGSGDNPYVLMWHGALAYAKGQKAEGCKRMYAAYTQFKAAEEWNNQSSQIAYWLAQAYKDSGEDGAVFEFTTNAVRGTRSNRGTSRPGIILDLAEMAIKLRLSEWTVTVIDQYEGVYGSSDRSKGIKVRALLASGKLDDASKLLDKMPADSADTLKFRLQLTEAELRATGLAKEVSDANSGAGSKQEAMLDKYIEKRLEIIKKLVVVAPKEVDAAQLVGVPNYLIKKGQLKAAREMVDSILAARPNDTSLQLLKLRLQEPDPSTISAERGKEMTLKVLNDISDPFEKAMNLGAFYASGGDKAAAAAQYNKAIELKPKDKNALSAAFDLAAQTGDQKRATELMNIAKAEDLDDCKGQVYEARLAMLDKQYERSLTLLDKCIELRPVYSLLYLLRSDVKDKLGKEMESINDAEKAASLNPLGVQATKQLAILLARRNEKLVGRVTAEQTQQAREALIKAVAANPSDTSLLNYYVQGISEERPEVAFAYTQQIYKASPTVENATRLGQMAVRMAQAERDIQKKEAMMQIAGSTFEEAYKKTPSNIELVRSYAEYYRLRGQSDKGEALIKSANSEDAQWRYYLNAGQLQQAKTILSKLYKETPKSADVVQGLIIVSQRSEDREGAIEYSRKFVELEDSEKSRLNLIQVLLNYNMTQDAYKELDGFKEKYPDDYRGNMLRAFAEMSDGRYAEARDMINKVLQSNQNDAGAWRLRGEIDSRMGDVDQAIAALQKSKLISDTVIIRMSLARAYLAGGRDNEAIEELRGALAMEQGLQEAAPILEQIYAKGNRLNELKALYEGILKLYPGNYVWRTKAAYLYGSTGDIGKATDYYKQAWRSSEEAGAPYEVALDGWLSSLNANSQYSDAVAFGSKYADGKLAPVALANMAVAAFKTNDKAGAIRYFEQAIQKTSESNVAMDIVGRMYNLLGKDETLKWCNQQLEKDAKSITASVAMYVVSLREGNLEDAVKYGDVIIGLSGEKTENGIAYRINKADILLKMYTMKQDTKLQAAAIKVLEELLPDLKQKAALQAKVWNNLAYMLAESGTRLDEAVNYAREAFDATPFDGNVLDTYAYALFKKGDYKQAKERTRSAIQYYEKGKETAPMEVYQRLGEITEKLGEKQEAVAAYKRALDVGGSKMPKDKSAELDAAIKRVSSSGAGK
jgi:tetratricopeptide (TPR) repeat protein